jgi:hypothetical protein
MQIQQEKRIFISYSQQNLRFHNSKLFLHPEWYLTIMPVNFYLNKSFFPHDLTLIASVMGESVIGRLTMVLAGSLSLPK